jgi:hypothetical protein
VVAHLDTSEGAAEVEPDGEGRAGVHDGVGGQFGHDQHEVGHAPRRHRGELAAGEEPGGGDTAPLRFERPLPLHPARYRVFPITMPSSSGGPGGTP